MSILNGSNDHDENIELKNEIEELKAQLRVANLKLKDKEFTLNKRNEDYEFQLRKSKEDLNNLRDKYDKCLETQRKLEKQNNDLEDRLLKIVQKYEEEQKTLLEELTIAHSQLVEAKLEITNIEKEKESYRQDCNIAVNLLQCKPGDFVKHSYSSLPVVLKDRLKTLISEDEAARLEEEGQRELEEYNKQKANSLFKIPIFQPTAAAAIMYNSQNHYQQQQHKKSVEHELNEDDSTRSYFNPLNYLSFFDTTSRDATSGKISSKLIAQVLKKEADAPSKKSYKLFPYVCLRCKKESIICSSSTQYDSNDVHEENLLLESELHITSTNTTTTTTTSPTQSEEKNDILLLNDNLISNEPSQSNYLDSFIV